MTIAFALSSNYNTTCSNYIWSNAVLPTDLTGKVFGRLTCLSPNLDKKVRRWNCTCVCGNAATPTTTALKSGKTKSCGCIATERMRALGKAQVTHGLSKGNKTPTYGSWLAMRNRCSPKYKLAKNYYDRGITICERWDDFVAFVEDMGERPEGCTLDRINVDGCYEPSNCRWASATTQQRNRRNTNYLKFKDGERIAMDVADELGIKKAAMSYFIKIARLMKEKYGYIPIP